MDIEDLVDLDAYEQLVTAGNYILVPGSHMDDRGTTFEVGTDVFTEESLNAIAPGALYRWDRVVGELVGSPGDQRFVAVSEHRLRAIADSHVKFARWKSKRDEGAVRVYTACTRDLAGLILAAAGLSPQVRELKLLTRYPVYGPDFELSARGWNESSGIYYDEPDDLLGLAPSSNPSLDVLDDLVIDFPFKDDASRHNVFGMMLTLIVRMAIAGNVPITLVIAALERVGKGKLLEAVIGGAILGQALPTMQLGSQEEEREKRITSLMLEGATAVHLDNLPTDEVLDSAALASLVTSRLWKGRLLGKSQTVTLQNNLVVLMSGNNVRATGELVKRTVPIVLQPLDDHPEDRTDFLHPDIEAHATKSRRVVIETLTGFVEYWKAAGRPGCDRRMGGFESWVQVVGGILVHAGATAWLSNYKAWIKRGDEWSADAEELVEAWADQFGTMEVTASQVLKLVKDTETFPVVTSRPLAGQVVSLARRVLRPLTDRPVGDWVVIRVGHGGASRYRLERQPPI